MTTPDPGTLVAVVIDRGLIDAGVIDGASSTVRAALAWNGHDPVVLSGADVAAELDRLEREAAPRWVWWSSATARTMVEHGIRPARCWDLTAVYRMLVGGWRSGPARVWAHALDLDPTTIPAVTPLDLFSVGVDLGDPEQPVGTDGHLRPEWVEGAWTETPERMVLWARLALDVQGRQAVAVDDVAAERPHIRQAVHAESAAELLCSEMEVDGLPFDRSVGDAIVAAFIGPRPVDAADAESQIRRRDHEVLQHVPTGSSYDLRSPEQVKSMLRRCGLEVPDTRAWRLEQMTGAHPIVEPLLAWRRAERMATTFGYHWIDDHVGLDRRLRGSWSASDGAAGRMTATAGLHNMPAEMRPAVDAGDGWMFVRADLGQIEPRILAAVSGDPALAAATQADDMYAPVADRLRVSRDIAKVAVLGAMYGQTTGRGAEALAGLEREYPVAMDFLLAADRAAQGGRHLRTYGGRLVRTGGSGAPDQPGGTDADDPSAGRDARTRAAARGRFGRNAMVQGAAAEFFKTWAVLMRARSVSLDARIVLCLHDELLVHVRADAADDAAVLLDRCLREAAHRWLPRSGTPVRFVSDTSIVQRWSDAH